MANRKLTTEQFLDKVKEKFVEEFKDIDISKAEYNGTNNEITLICPKHYNIS